VETRNLPIQIQTRRRRAAKIANWLEGHVLFCARCPSLAVSKKWPSFAGESRAAPKDWAYRHAPGMLLPSCGNYPL